MRTTLDLPEELIAEAMQLTGSKTKTAVIVEALTEVIRKNKIADIRSYKGKVDLEIDLNEIRGRAS